MSLLLLGLTPPSIISKNGRSGASFLQGGTINLDFNAFEDGLVDLESLRISGTTRPGTVAVYRDGVRLSSAALSNTGTSGSQTVSLNVSDADRLTVTLTGPGRLDDIVFTN